MSYTERNEKSIWSRGPLDVDNFRPVNRHINDLTHCRGNDNGGAVYINNLLRGRVKVPKGTGLGSQALNGIHQVGGLIQKRSSQVGRPTEVVTQHFKNLGITGEGFDTRVPRLKINGSQITATGHVTVRPDDLLWDGCRRQDLGKERVWVQGDRGGHLFEFARRTQHRRGSRGDHYLGRRGRRRFCRRLISRGWFGLDISDLVFDAAGCQHCGARQQSQSSSVS
jgi:hypothetical protein